MSIDQHMTRSIVHASQEDTIRDVISLMIQHEVSSVLLHDDEMKVVGILTERDVVRKFALLQKEDKLDSKVITVMSRPVIYADAANLEQSVRSLHEKYGFRHFPVKSDQSDSVQEVLGILTLTDLIKTSAPKSEDSIDKPVQQSENNKALVVLCNNAEARLTYAELLKVYDIEVDLICGDERIREFLSEDTVEKPFVLYDMDFFSVKENLQYLEFVRSWPLILVTSEEKLLIPYRSHFKQSNQHIFLKPLDLSYLAWILHRHASSEVHSANNKKAV